MDTVVFTDPLVIGFFTNDMILVKVNIDSSVDLTRSYGVTGFPTFVLLDEQGKEIDRTYGYHTAEELTTRLRAIQNREGLFWDLIQTGRNTTDRRLMLQLAEGYRVRGLIPEAEGWYRRAIDSGPKGDSLTTEASLYLGYMYFLVKDWKRLQPVYAQFMSDYPTHPYAADIMMMLANCHYQLREFDNASALYRQFIERYPNAEGYVKTATERLAEIAEAQRAGESQ